jgi:hypothetical protein
MKAGGMSMQGRGDIVRCAVVQMLDETGDVVARRQFNIVSAMLARWCTNVMRSKVGPMKHVATIIRTHFDGIVAWARFTQDQFIRAGGRS